MQANGVHPAAADGHRVVVQANQDMALRSLRQSTLEKHQLFSVQEAEYRAGHQRIEHDHAPAANIQYRQHHLAIASRLTHRGQFVMVARAPAERSGNTLGQLAKPAIGSNRAILGKVTSGQYQINLRLLLQHQIDDSLQALRRVHAQQLSTRLGEQVAVGQLHEQHRILNGGQGRSRQGPSPLAKHAEELIMVVAPCKGNRA